MRPIYVSALKILESLITLTDTFPEILMGFYSNRPSECVYEI